ncbi:MAG: YerC/YecD family TrpR-related protein [Eubacteriales bacterium]|nr:YerC/YecD family TrpR-related protein [Eubacteriales bacterium]
MAYEPKIRNEHTDALMDALLSLQTPEECYRLFEDMCTVNELLAMTQRLQVAGMLRANITYHDIVERTGASTATISRVNRCLNYGAGGYAMILERQQQKTQEK